MEWHSVPWLDFAWDTLSKTTRGFAHKMKGLTLVDRKTKQARNIIVDDLKRDTLLPILRENISKEVTSYTDEAKQYTHLCREFAAHDFTTRSKGEYGRGPVHTNTVEGYFSIFKRGMKGVYQDYAKKHLHRYAADFEFRYNNRSANGIENGERGALALSGAFGKRLTYQRTDEQVMAM